MVPPGWMSEGGAVTGDEVTLPMPTLICVTALLGAAVTVDFLAVVPVVFLAVVAVPFAAAVVGVPATADVSVVAAWVVSVVWVAAAPVVSVVADVLFLLLVPPQAAATNPAVTITVKARQCLPAPYRLACAPLMSSPSCPV